MIGIDTNVLLRAVVLQDEHQSPLAERFLRSLTMSSPGFVSLLVLCEFAWVLTVTYKRPRLEIAVAIERILNLPMVVTEQAERASAALRAYRAGSADFADCCIEQTGLDAGCEHTVTFDATASRMSGMRLLR